MDLPVIVSVERQADGTVQVLYGRGPDQRYRVTFLASRYDADRVETVRRHLASLPDWSDLPYA